MPGDLDAATWTGWVVTAPRVEFLTINGGLRAHRGPSVPHLSEADTASAAVLDAVGWEVRHPGCCSRPFKVTVRRWERGAWVGEPTTWRVTRTPFLDCTICEVPRG